MSEFYRFRSMKSLFGEYLELEKQTIYFASPEELNDPMEGLRHLVWTGDEIVWTNFFKHYVFCLHRTFLWSRLTGSDKELNADSIPISGRWDELTTSHEKDLFDDIWTRFLNVPNMQAIIKAITDTKRKIGYRDMRGYLRIIHAFVLAEIQKSHIERGLLSESKISQPDEELNDSSFLEGYLYLIRKTQGIEDTELSDDALLPLEITDESESIFQQYNSRTTFNGVLGKNDQFVTFDFPKAYLEQLERLLWPRWYTACFMNSCHNSSVWGHYGDNHKGICLIFEAEETNESESLELRQLIGENIKTMPFHEVKYKDQAGEVDFFRSIAKLPVAALKRLWYTDQEGNISECAAHIGPDADENAWRESYWANFFRDITIKTKDWEYEQEFRLILEDSLSQFEDKEDRTLRYDFNSLKGIIFGLKTSDEDKQRIIRIIEEKCRKNNRTDFKLFQAYYSQENGDIRNYEVQLPFRTDSSSDVSGKELRAYLAVQQGNFRMELGEMDGAIEAYTRAIRLDPNYAEAHYKRGFAYYVKGDYDRANEDLKQSIQLNPDLAIVAVTEAIEQMPNDASLYWHRGTAYARKSHYDCAIKDFNNAIQLNPDVAEAYYSRGLAYYNRGNFDRAIEDFNAAIKLKPDYTNAYIKRGTAYLNKGDYIHSLDDFTKVLERKTDDAMVYALRGTVYRKLSSFVLAIADYTKAIELNLNDAQVYCCRGLTYHDEGDFDRAIKDYTKVIQLNRNFAEAYHCRGNAYNNIGDVDRAISDFDSAIALKPDYAETYNQRGVAYYTKGYVDRAIKDYTKAIEKNPDYAYAYNNRGVAYSKKGPMEAAPSVASAVVRAIKDYNSAIGLNPELAQAYYNRGEAWLRLGECEKAKSDLMVAREKGIDLVTAFRGEYESVPMFEERNGVKLPENIAEMLTLPDV